MPAPRRHRRNLRPRQQLGYLDEPWTKTVDAYNDEVNDLVYVVIDQPAMAPGLLADPALAENWLVFYTAAGIEVAWSCLGVNWDSTFETILRFQHTGELQTATRLILGQDLSVDPNYDFPAGPPPRGSVVGVRQI